MASLVLQHGRLGSHGLFNLLLFLLLALGRVVPPRHARVERHLRDHDPLGGELHADPHELADPAVELGGDVARLLEDGVLEGGVDDLRWVLVHFYIMERFCHLFLQP